jgi:hypothetical protein
MQTETTLSDIYEEIAEKLALARTRALMGESCEALGIFQAASLEYTRFRDVLSAYPGFYALEHAFRVTMTALQAEEQHAAEIERPAQAPKAAPRKRNRRAA